MKIFNLLATLAILALCSFSTLAVAGKWSAYQNGVDLFFDTQQSGATLTGTVRVSDGNTGNLSGSVTGNQLDFTVNWNGGNVRGRYTGTIGQDGFIRDGFAYDIDSPWSQAAWNSTSVVSLGGDGSKPVSEVLIDNNTSAYYNALGTVLN